MLVSIELLIPYRLRQSISIVVTQKYGNIRPHKEKKQHCHHFFTPGNTKKHFTFAQSLNFKTTFSKKTHK